MKFVAMVEIKPAFKLKDYKGLKVKKESTEVARRGSGKGLGRGLGTNWRNSFRWKTGQPKTDDLVVIDFEGKIKGTVFEGGKAERYPVLLGSQSLLKDFEANLIGMGKGGSKTFKIKFPADYGKKDVAGQEAEFTVALHEIKAKKLPAMDDEFAKSAGQGRDLEGVQGKARGPDEILQGAGAKGQDGRADRGKTDRGPFLRYSGFPDQYGTAKVGPAGRGALKEPRDGHQKDDR